jgi:predicted SnoaL-like aldol condensation-catalyzing enzyme
MFRVLLSILLISVLVFAPVVAQETETDPNILVVERFLEQFNTASYDAALFTPDFVLHQPLSMHIPTLNHEATIAWMQTVHEQFPDMTKTVVRMIHEGDFVTVQYELTYTDPSGVEKVVPGMDMYRIEEGKLAEAWLLYDTLLMSGQSDSETNTALVEAFLQAEMNHDYDQLDALVADDFAWHSTASPDVLINSRDAFMQHLEVMMGRFPASCNQVLMVSAEGDYVVVYGRFVAEFTDELCSMDITAPVMLLFRIENGKIAEEWLDWEHIPFMGQAELWSVTGEVGS